MEVNPDPFRGPVQYGLEVNTGDALRSETRINGIAVARCEVGEQGVDLLAIHHDVLPGENLAEVVLALPGMAFEARPHEIGAPPSSARCRLMLQGDVGELEGDELTITTHRFALDEWPTPAGPAPLRLPHRLRIPFTPGFDVTPPPWIEGARAEADAVREAVRAETGRLAQLIATGDLDAYRDATRLRRQHHARCYPIQPGAMSDIDQIAALRGARGFRIMVAPPHVGRLRVQADGRLFDWVGPDDEPGVMVATDLLPPSPIALQFSLLGGGLHVTR
jgi:hypothetical protein